MIDLAADHVGFVVACYGAAALVFAGLVVRSVLTARYLRRELAARGLTDAGQKEKTS